MEGGGSKRRERRSSGEVVTARGERGTVRKKDRRTEVSGTGRQKAGKEGERQSQSETTELTIESLTRHQ